MGLLVAAVAGRLLARNLKGETPAEDEVRSEARRPAVAAH
jgi:hypothetical protein